MRGGVSAPALALALVLVTSLLVLVFAGGFVISAQGIKPAVDTTTATVTLVSTLTGSTFFVPTILTWTILSTVSRTITQTSTDTATQTLTETTTLPVYSTSSTTITAILLSTRTSSTTITQTTTKTTTETVTSTTTVTVRGQTYTQTAGTPTTTSTAVTSTTSETTSTTTLPTDTSTTITLPNLNTTTTTSSTTNPAVHTYRFAVGYSVTNQTLYDAACHPEPIIPCSWEGTISWPSADCGFAYPCNSYVIGPTWTSSSLPVQLGVCGQPVTWSLTLNGPANASAMSVTITDPNGTVVYTAATASTTATSTVLAGSYAPC